MLLPRADDKHDPPPYEATHPESAHSTAPSSGLSGGAIAGIVLVVLLALLAISWVILTNLRARRLGLPSPTLRDYIPFLPSNKRSLASSAALEPTRPTGGLMSRFLGGSHGYSGTKTRSDRMRGGALDEWDDRMEEELEYRGAGGRYGGGVQRGADAPYPVEEDGMPAAPNPFDRDVERVRAGEGGFGDVGVRGGRGSMESLGQGTERRSVFREGI